MRRVADPQATPVGNFPVRPGLAGFISERWPASNRYAWPECVGIRTLAVRAQQSRTPVALRRGLFLTVDHLQTNSRLRAQFPAMSVL